MTVEEINQLVNGLYIIVWKAEEGGGFSLASLGRDREGNVWIAPDNWTIVGGNLWDHLKQIDKMHLIMSRPGVSRILNSKP